MDGMKMSKSMGNILPLRKAIAEYGADVIRFSVVSGADMASDTDFSKTVAEGTRSRLVFINALVQQTAKEKKSKPHGQADKWLLSRLNRKIKIADEMYDKCMMRNLGLEIFYDIFSDLKWYEKRAESPNLHAFFKKWVLLISPFMPYHADEFWKQLGGKGFVQDAGFPKYDDLEVDDGVERGEEMVKAVHGDVEKISQLLGKTPKKVGIYIASGWKRKLYEIVREHKLLPKVMQASAADPDVRPFMKNVPTAANQLVKNAYSLGEILSEKDELGALVDAKEFFKKEFGCDVVIDLEINCDHPRAKNAMPNKPAIVIE
jgi:leucyl-tRNA synthetase